jgi:hypothetical protein
VRENAQKQNIIQGKFYDNVDRGPFVYDRDYSPVRLKTDRTRRNLNNRVI